MYAVEKTIEGLGTIWDGSLAEIQVDLKRHYEYNVAPALGSVYHRQAGSVFGYEKLLKGIKKSLDPQNISCPPQPIPED